MTTNLSTEPKLATPFPKRVRYWKCPETGLYVPKDPDTNLVWRSELLQAAQEDIQLQTDLVTACTLSPLFFVNAFAFTLRVFESTTNEQTQAEAAVVPYVTWDIQDRHIMAIEDAIDVGRDLGTDKSRDMGATWDHMVVYARRLIFAQDPESHLLLSRKEDEVDSLDGIPRNYPFGPLSDPGKLFGKIDFVLSRLPQWMLPRLARKKLHLINLDTGTRLVGESANATAGSSNRTKSIFLDEMAKMDNAESIKRSTRDVSKCRLPCSTPNGAGTAYSEWILSGQIPVFRMPWYEHPEKGKGRYVTKDDLGRYKIRSPWYDAECEKRTPKEMAIEIDMDHIGSGDTFFEANIIEEHKKLYARAPYRSIKIRLDPTVPDKQVPLILQRRDVSKVKITPRGPMKLWFRPSTEGRPDQSYSYVVSVDISKGMGASNSVINVTNRQTREKIAAYADANTPPYELARIAVAVCLWVGGSDTLPLLIWENNGDPGFDFGRMVTKTLEYPNVYYDRAPGTVAEKRGKRFGWRSSPEKKAQALGMLRRAYAHGGYINRDEDSLDEALQYVYYEGGGIGPAALVEESASARKTHGDRVIGDMLAAWILDDTAPKRKAAGNIPQRSFAARKQAWDRKRRRRNKETRFNFAAR